VTASGGPRRDSIQPCRPASATVGDCRFRSSIRYDRFLVRQTCQRSRARCHPHRVLLPCGRRA
jgi:hypothetical protein